MSSEFYGVQALAQLRTDTLKGHAAQAPVLDVTTSAFKFLTYADNTQYNAQLAVSGSSVKLSTSSDKYDLGDYFSTQIAGTSGARTVSQLASDNATLYFGDTDGQMKMSTDSTAGLTLRAENAGTAKNFKLDADQSYLHLTPSFAKIASSSDQYNLGDNFSFQVDSSKVSTSVGGDRALEFKNSLHTFTFTPDADGVTYSSAGKLVQDVSEMALTTSTAGVTISSAQAISATATTGNVSLGATAGAMSLTSSDVMTLTSSANLSATATGNVSIGASTGTMSFSAFKNMSLATTESLSMSATKDASLTAVQGNLSVGATAGWIAASADKYVDITAGENVTVTAAQDLTAVATAGNVSMGALAGNWSASAQQNWTAVANAGNLSLGATAGNLIAGAQNQVTVTAATGDLSLNATAARIVASSGDDMSLATNAQFSMTAAEAVALTSTTSTMSMSADAGISMASASGNWSASAGSFTTSARDDILMNATAGNVSIGATAGNLALTTGAVMALSSTDAMSLSSADTLSLSSTGNMSMISSANIATSATGNLSLGAVTGTLTASSAGDMSLASLAIMTLSSTDAMSLTSADTLMLNSTGNMSMTSSAAFTVTATDNYAVTSQTGNVSLNAAVGTLSASAASNLSLSTSEKLTAAAATGVDVSTTAGNVSLGAPAGWMEMTSLNAVKMATGTGASASNVTIFADTSSVKIDTPSHRYKFGDNMYLDTNTANVIQKNATGNQFVFQTSASSQLSMTMDATNSVITTSTNDLALDVNTLYMDANVMNHGVDAAGNYRQHLSKFAGGVYMSAAGTDYVSVADLADLNADYPNNVLVVKGGAHIDGAITASTFGKEGADVLIKGRTITLDANEVILTGSLERQDVVELVVQDKQIVLGNVVDGDGNPATVSDTSLDNAGIVLAGGGADNQPVGDTTPLALLWSKQQGLYNSSNQLVSSTQRARWELSGGNFMIKGNATYSYMFGVDGDELAIIRVNNSDGSTFVVSRMGGYF